MKKYLPHIEAAVRAAFIFLSICMIPMAEATTLCAPLHNSKVNKMDNKKTTSYSFSEPDFAFPETVEKNADRKLNEALDKKDGVEAIQAAIQIVVARNLVSKSSFQANITLVDSVANLIDAPYSSLCRLIEAGMYAQFYTMQQWLYNGRTLPLDSYPDDVNAWSGQLFAKKVLELVDKATEGISVANQLPLADIANLLVSDSGLKDSGLSVADFIVSQSVRLLRNFESVNAENVIPFRNVEEKGLYSPKELCIRRANSLLDSRIKMAEDSHAIKPLTFFLLIKAENIYFPDKSAFLKTWKDKLLSYPEGAVFLCEYCDAVFNSNYIGTADSKLLYSQMEEWLKSFPGSNYAEAVKYKLGLLKMKNVAVSAAENIYPNKAGKCVVSVQNVSDMYVLIYKIPELMVKNGSLSVKDFPGNAKCMHTIPLKFEGSIPFSSRREFDLPLLESGYYVAVPSASAKLSSDWKSYVDKWSLTLFNVTNLSLITVTNPIEENSGLVYVVDAMTQKPVEGVVVNFFENDNKKMIKEGISSREGSVSLPQGYFRIEAKKNSDHATLWAHNRYTKITERKEDCANIFTDLSIYRPGDEVQFALVAWTRTDEKTNLRKNVSVKVVLLDANANDVDSLSLSTDEWGRCDGRFRLPSDGLLGTYQLVAEFSDNPRRRVGYQYFEVAEYKTPSFYVELQKDSTENYVPGDLIKFKGVVKTYSGMPLAGVEVNYNVRWNPWWRFMRSYNTATYGNTILTDEKGEFIIELPTADLKGTQYEYGIYSLAASATSPSGETQSAPDLRFALGTELSIRPQINERTCVTGGEIKFNIPVYDMLDLPTVKDVEYKIVSVSDPDKTLSGVFKSPSLTLPASRLTSGQYRMEFNVVGDTVKTNVETIIYRQNDTKCPVETPLWVPENKIIAKPGVKSVDIKVGSGYSGSYILSVISDKNGILKKEWLLPSEDLIKVNIPAPVDKNSVWVTLSGMHDFNQNVATVEIVPENSLRKMEVTTSVFRDKISSGDSEEWKFTFTVGDEVQRNIPAFAVMTDKALNALAPFTWRFNAYGFGRGMLTSVSSSYINNFTTSAHFTRNPKYVAIAGFSPEWNTYSYDLVSAGLSNIRIRGTRMMKAAQTTGNYGVVEEQVAVGMEEDADHVMNATVKSEATMASMDLAEEKVVEADGGNGNMVNDEAELRPIEMPLMFFMPRLNSNADGDVEVSFDVPNFNTTWQFQLMGYNDELQSASIILDAVASKPVMVRSNPPRFVRTGDKMSIAATLFNNTDSVSAISGRIELFNPDSDEILLQREFSAEEITASGNRTVEVQFDVPDNISSIGIRSYAVAGKFSDGEQTVIAVLPSSTPVVESTNFYLKTGETDFAVKLPKFKKDANLTLKYCDNPVWECVLALPSISAPDSKNVFSVIRALFANSMAVNIVERYPGVKEGLQKIFAENDTALLTSNLQKDSELKTVTLNNTPWVNDARSETERMRSLDKLLDKQSADASVASLLSNLKDLQSSSGGWSWCPGMPASEFITRNVIKYSGIMKQSDCLPADAEEMIEKAIKFCDDKAYDYYLKNNKKIYALDMLSYLYARSFFNYKSSNSGFEGLKNKALKKISEEWKQFSIYDKTIAAIVMARSNGYEKTARVILESLNQYASKDGVKGWWFDNLSSGFDGMPKLLTTATALEAYSEIEPGTDAVEGLRQWLVLQKATENWGANSYTVEVIGAILNSGVNWTESREPATFQIGDNLISVDDREMLTGMVTLNLDPSEASGKELKINKHSSGPAWGGVISQYVAPIKDVKAEKSANLKIEKQLLVVKDSPAGEIATEGQIHVGDKVRVTLTLTCDKDMDYVALIDERGAFLEPADQVSGYSLKDRLAVYQEVRDSKTSFFIEFLPKGTSVITYDCYADREGEYSVGITSVQSQYSPLQAAHSAGRIVIVK
ncbi:MAG: hypothetical protein HDR88_15695 [Bacteroides sp.]|nr:hypothetical protein [Bacteroides sp.]